jgi:hypothetical protein
MSEKSRRSGHATGMAGEFYVMERLFRLGHEPALTLGNAKSIDILVLTKNGVQKKISVKAVCGGGKWGVDNREVSTENNMIYVFLIYKNFEDVTTDPEVWIMPANEVEKRKKPWFEGSAIYYSHKENTPKDLAEFKNAWHYIER